MGSTVSSPNVKCLTSSTRFLWVFLFVFFRRQCPESFRTHLVNTPSSTLSLNNYMFLELRGGGGGAAALLVISRKINIFAYCPKRDHANLQKKLFLLVGGRVLCLLFPVGSCRDEEKTVTRAARQQTITDHMILKSLKGWTWKFQ